MNIEKDGHFILMDNRSWLIEEIMYVEREVNDGRIAIKMRHEKYAMRFSSDNLHKDSNKIIQIVNDYKNKNLSL